MRGALRLVVCAAAAALLTGCELAGLELPGIALRRSEPSLSSALIIPVTATNVRKLDVYDGKVMYEMPEPYPGTQFITTVHTALNKDGWKMRAHDFMDRQRPLPGDVRWTDVEAEGRRETVWSEQWENKKGDIAWYRFKYLSPARTRGKPGGPMYVEATYLRPETAKSLIAVTPDAPPQPRPAEAPRRRSGSPRG